MRTERMTGRKVERAMMMVVGGLVASICTFADVYLFVLFSSLNGAQKPMITAEGKGG